MKKWKPKKKNSKRRKAGIRKRRWRGARRRQTK
jgi:hypothetical protein